VQGERQACLECRQGAGTLEQHSRATAAETVRFLRTVSSFDRNGCHKVGTTNLFKHFWADCDTPRGAVVEKSAGESCLSFSLRREPLPRLLVMTMTTAEDVFAKDGL
jgi:hypothetical protein